MLFCSVRRLCGKNDKSLCIRDEREVSVRKLRQFPLFKDESKMFALSNCRSRAAVRGIAEDYEKKQFCRGGEQGKIMGLVCTCQAETLSKHLYIAVSSSRRDKAL